MRSPLWIGSLFSLLFVTLLASQGISAPVVFDDPNPQIGATFGSAMAVVGDVNGDGVPDLLVGAPLQDVGGNADQGQAYLISGATGIVIRTLDDPIPQLNAYFGSSVASAGDVDGDGKNDLLIGAPGQNVGLCANSDTAGCSVGEAFVFSSATGSVVHVLDHPFPHSGSFFGSAVASGGGRIIVGTPGQNIGVLVPSYVFVFDGTTANHLLTIGEPNPAEAESNVGLTFGSVVASIGDVDNDGVPDILVGDALQDVGGNADQGQLHVFSGATGGLLYTLNDPVPQPYAHFGVSVASVGDVNGDGKPDILIGASQQDAGSNYEQGEAFVFSGFNGTLLLTLDNPIPQASGEFGAAVASAGDASSSGGVRFLIGAPGQRVNGINQGQAFLFGADGSLLQILDDPSAQVDAWFGANVASGWDINGDGILDPLVAAPLQNVGNNLYQGEIIQFQAVGGGGGGGSGIDLTGTITKLKHKSLCDKGKGDDRDCERDGDRRDKERLEFSLQIVNIGTEESRGGFTVKFYLSSDSTLDGNDLLVFTRSIKDTDGDGRIKPGKKITVSGNIVVPGSVEGRFLIVFIDADNSIAESNESNNIAVRQIP